MTIAALIFAAAGWIAFAREWRAHVGLTVRRNTLFDAIKHGDDEHRAWLRKAIDEHFAPITPSEET